MFDIRLCGKPMGKPGKTQETFHTVGEAANTKWRWYSHPPWRRKYLIKSSSAKISRRIFSEGSLDSSCKESPLQRDCHYYLEWASYSNQTLNELLFNVDFSTKTSQSATIFTPGFSPMWHRATFQSSFLGSPLWPPDRTTLKTFPEFFWGGCRPVKVPNFQLCTNLDSGKILLHVTRHFFWIRMEYFCGRQFNILWEQEYFCGRKFNILWEQEYFCGSSRKERSGLSRPAGCGLAHLYFHHF